MQAADGMRLDGRQRGLLPILVIQAQPSSLDDLAFEELLRSGLAMAPHTRLAAFPELHLHPERRGKRIEDMAEPIPGPRIHRLGDLARDLGIWLLPGSLYERAEDGSIYNTAVALAPDGTLAAAYRKIFPWRPYETVSPGTEFVVFNIPRVGQVGLSICYDTWFPEVARHLAWMGADVIIQSTCTFTSDREHELILARATAIMNQVFVVNVNTAAPYATGRSVVIDPEGRVRSQASESALTLTEVLDLADVDRVRALGTAGVDRVWRHFQPGDPELPLPLYEGRIDPLRWAPATQANPERIQTSPAALLHDDSAQARSRLSPKTHP